MKVSVIIPCYRAQDTLTAAVQSALAGAPPDLEVILIDDGSPDGTGALCDRLAAREPRVRALHQPNRGVSAARNAGLDAAKGDWILFLDADDELLPGLWQALPDKPPAPMILFGLRRASTGEDVLPGGSDRLTTLPELGEELGRLLFESGLLAAPYPKLFQKSPLRFDETLKINEDVLFNIQFLQNTTAIYLLNGVYYKQNDLLSGSLSRRPRTDLLQAEARTRPALETLLRRHGIKPDAYLQKSRVRAALNQYGLLTGYRGSVPFAERKAAFAGILKDEDARRALRSRLRGDPHRILALPYRIGVALRSPFLLAAYTHFKNRFL